MEKKTVSNTRLIAEGGITLAIAIVLSFLKIEMPWMIYGGSISFVMVPLALMSLRNGAKWGSLTAFAFGIFKLILGFENVGYCATLLAQIGCIFLDYVLAYTCIGLAGLFAACFVKKNRIVGHVFGTVVAGLLMFVCSFLSGWLLWGSYAPEGMNVLWYSFVYNISYMGPNILIAAVVIGILSGAAPKLFRVEQ